MKERPAISMHIMKLSSAVFGFTLLLSGLSEAATTITPPEYSKPLLDPASQTNAWTTVIPNALADYFTYVPYRTADAVKLGFPSSCGRLPDDAASTEDCYTITAKKFRQALELSAIFGGGKGLLDANGTPFGETTWVYGYGSGGVNWAPPGAPSGVTVTGNAPTPFVDKTFGTTGIWHFPAPTIKGTKGRPVRITWLNELPNEKPTGFDPTICDGNPTDCYPYNRIVTHVHGAHTTPESDGFANAWFTPGFALKGADWTSTASYGPEGTYRYPMDQEASTIWYHDHAMGLTHNNTNMGMAGFFPITDDNEKRLQGVGGTKYLPTGDYELGFAFQDRVFYNDGQLAMPDTPIINTLDTNCTYTYQPDGTITPNDLSTCTNTPKFMKDAKDGHLIPYVAGPGVQPLLATSTTLEFFGNMPVVNGVVYGTYPVEPRVYRMRFINGTDSRTWVPRLKVVGSNPEQFIPFFQVGTEQGLLNKPVQRDSIVFMPGERIDVLVDFNGLPKGTKVVMQNLGPDMPFDGDISALPTTPIDYVAFNPDPDITTHPDAIPEIMMFDVSVSKTVIPDVPPPSTSLNLRPLNGPITSSSLIPTPGTPVRNVSLMEIHDEFGRTLPTIDGRDFMMVPVTERPKLGDIEEWHIINTTADAHPMHLHQVSFLLIEREGFTSFTPPGMMGGALTQPDYVGNGVKEVPTAGTPSEFEIGWKDTIMVPFGKVTKIKARFDIPGLYVWHCHILSHEEHDMMRPLFVGNPMGNLTGGTTVDIKDALRALQVSVGLVTPTTFETVRGDVAPLVNGVPKPDGKVDLADALLILRRALGIVTW